uniref:Uncharacterized protein n=1 Tax=Rhizophora mucronata TaxID=61149 RepID=A0A2P2M0Y0_RHIMU
MNSFELYLLDWNTQLLIL